MSLDAKEIAAEGAKFQFGSIIESILPKIQPFINPFIKAVEDIFGNDEFMAVVRKNTEDGKIYIHVMKTKEVEMNLESHDTITYTKELDDFIKEGISGEFSKFFGNKEKEGEQKLLK